MKLQDIRKQLNETRCWYIVLTPLWNERKTKEALESEGIIACLPTESVVRKWNERSKEIKIPAANRCVFVYASEAEVRALQNTYPVFPLDEVAEKEV